MVEDEMVVLKMLFVLCVLQNAVLNIVADKQDVPVYLWSKTDLYFVSDDHRLDGYKFTEKPETYTLLQCAMSCRQHPSCQSYNYRQATALCELNSEAEEMAEHNLIPQAGVVYMRKHSYTIDLDAVSACSSEPCANGGQCLHLQNLDGNQTFHCLCSKDWAGETCLNPVSPVTWSQWGSWGACSVSCGEGWQLRTRECIDQDAQTRSPSECQGLQQEQRLCPGLQPCPRWDAWSKWSTCSTSRTCGMGQQVRTRNCLHGGIPGLDRMCMGYFLESTPCKQPSCDTVIQVDSGSSIGDGWLSIYNDLHSSWGAVCADGWTKQVADIACHQIGYPRGSADLSLDDGQTSASSNQTFYLSDINCNGTEATLAECDHTDWDSEITCNSGTVYLQCTVDGGWNSWTGWGECSVTCAEGIRLRHRSCDYPSPQRGGVECPGTDVESKACVMGPCPVDGEWHLWTEWGSCNRSCGGGSQQRTRECNLPKHGGQACTGETDQWRECNTHHCPIDCEWNLWSQWGECNTTCGGGWQMRSRDTLGPFYGGLNCTGPANDWRECNTHHCPIDCAWNSWLEWQACNVTCGGGGQVRLREPDGPYYGGDNCTGSTEDWQECNTHHCPVDCIWSSWQGWEVCNRSCGGGWQYRERITGGPYHGGQNCTGEHIDWKTCHEQSCPVDCVWNDWTHWSACNTSCGGGWRERRRGKEGPQHDGQECVGEPIEWSTCNEHHCPVNGSWLSWSDWTECSVSCANGTQQRNRTCEEPIYGGLACDGNTTQIQDCFLRHCPVDGEWSIWGVWSRCTHTCGNSGTQYKTRMCREPLYGGSDCPGSDRMTQKCNELSCPENGFWKSWSSWSECSMSCGGGSTERSRQCIPPLHGGTNCTGEGEEVDSCNTHPCPVDGYWLEWSTWSVCTVRCGGGTTSRSRHCVEPLHGGLDCDGLHNETKTCNDQPCPENGNTSVSVKCG